MTDERTDQPASSDATPDPFTHHADTERAPPPSLAWGCLRAHGAGDEPCGPECWLAQPDIGDPGPLEPTVELWNAINDYAETCGGDTGAATISGRRMDAVVAVDRAVTTLESGTTIRALLGAEGSPAAHWFETPEHASEASS